MTTATNRTLESSPVPALSELMKTGSRAEHTAAEDATFVRTLLDGRINRAGYAAYLSQLFYIYEALESVGDALREDPIAKVVLRDELLRLPALENDLRYWGLSEPQLPTEATLNYVDRIRNHAANWGGAYVAHHYTRYLGDLSGGQAIGRILARTYDLADGQGVQFYDFPAIAKVKIFKDNYRLALNSLALTDEEKLQVLDEVKVAFVLNSGLFASFDDRLDEFTRP